MAFVYKDKNRFQIKPPTRSKVGPGTYVGHSVYNISKSNVPFLSSSYRKSIKSEEKPGPGSYNVSNEYLKEKFIASNLNMDVKIVEIPKPNYVFKSTSQRFSDNNLRKGGEPGPGDYTVDENIDKIAHKYMKQQSPERILVKEIKKNNKYQNIPSIPSKQQILGYCETEGFFYKLIYFVLFFFYY